MTNHLIEQTLTKEDALARGQTLVAEIRALLKKAKARPVSLGGEGSGNFGHAGRPGEVGGSGSGGGRESGSGVTWHDAEPVDKTKFLWAEEGTKNDGGRLLVTNGGAQQITAKLLKQVLPGRDLADVASQIAEEIPGDVTATWKVQTVYGGRPSLGLQIKRKDKLNIEYTFTRQSDGSLVVHHDKVEVPKESQGQGLAKDLMASSYRLYDKIGVKRVDLQANLDQGGYAWAKFGFKANNPRAMAERLTTILTTPQQRVIAERMPPLNDAERQAAVTLVDQHKNDPRLPWFIAGLKMDDGRETGKAMLNLSGWSASMEMNDTEARDRMNRYTATKKKATR